jgi:hypothetical protein
MEIRPATSCATEAITLLDKALEYREFNAAKGG